MADPPSHQGNDMAVQNSLEQRSDDQNGREENDQAPSRILQKVRNVDGQYKKKSSFQITGVYPAVKSGLDPDGDSLDDLDETAETHTEDVSSDILDISKTTDIDPDPSSTEEISTPNHLTNDESPGRDVASLNLLDGEQNGSRDKDMSKDLQSRFKVVKIESTEPFRRGRWLCHDFMAPSKDGEKKEKGEKGEKDEGVGSGNSSAASSIHYIHGVDDPAKNPLGPTIIHSEGHPIVEPQPIYPSTTQGQGLNGDYDYTAQQSQKSLSQTTGQGIVLQESTTPGTVPQAGYQSIGQGMQTQSNGTSTQMQQLVGQNSVSQPSTTVQQSDTNAQNQDFMTRSQEFVSQSQDYLAQQTEYTATVPQLAGSQTSGEVPSSQTPNTQNAQLPQTPLSSQDSLGVQPAQNSKLGEYGSQQGQTTAVSPNVAKSNASPSNENLNVKTAESTQDSSFNASVAEDIGSGVQHIEPVPSSDAEPDPEKRAPDGAVAAETASSSGVPVAVSGTAQDLLTPPLLEMVSATMQQPGGIILSKDSGDER